MSNPNTSDRIELMQTFIRIVESGSLSAAAAQLGTTQPTISRRLQTLEQRLGLKLILRTTHALKLTDDGERCYAQARQLLATWHALEDELTGASDDPVGTLRVRAPHAFGQDQLIAPLVDYLRRYPRLNIEWMLNDRTPDFMAENIDCAIQVGAPTDPSVVAILLAEVPRIVVASPGLLARHPPIEQVEQLRDLPWLALTSFYRNEVALQKIDDGQPVNLAITPRLSSDSLYAVRKAALAGMGAAIVSSWVVQQDLAEGRLVQLTPQWQAPPLPIWLTYPWASYYPARLQHFFTMIKAVMPQLAGTRPATAARRQAEPEE
ncbi:MULTISPECIES: LysR family transcriptional regulator [Pantoea]|jgi:DNA-binding transcriptional LysR family regulator|uniref:LysR family transcriptional regulator n=1 Tax=Pantoea brenneri TaxID=472694 RepID=A0A7Y6TSE2_9GAMM|nr:MULTISPECIES: LysR family transcriptional regulator [Pantoea]KKD31230.1 LysR family transcriptional regulator [Pantoea sp. 3.5.1]MBZ6395786.1 LysR family transcriptional regulator [Pantoea sp.]MBZ6439047.1 LysR family transcriptional regulator [Pantoea sp.]MCQ5472252.1 LysR family transcriptional regulator [Pantoea brenneri]NUY42111.1 LysR family transcriptional regulator [Pantoea brenneri]